MTQTPAGWYPDPYGIPQLRWWNGSQWTDATHPLVPTEGQAAPDASAGPETVVVAPAEREPSEQQRPEGEESSASRPAEPSPGETRVLDGPPTERGAADQGGTPDEQGPGPVPQGFGAQGTGEQGSGGSPTVVLPDPGAGVNPPTRQLPDPEAGVNPPTRQLPPQEQWAPPSGTGSAGPSGGPAGPQSPGWPGPQGPGFAQQAGPPFPQGPGFAQQAGPPFPQGPGFAQQGPPPYPLPGYPTGMPPRQRGGVWPWVLGGGGALIILAAIIVAVVLMMNRDQGTVAGPTAPPLPTEVPPSVPSAPTTPFPSLPPVTPSAPTETPTEGATEIPQPVDGRITDPVSGLSYEMPKGKEWGVLKQLVINPVGRWTSGAEAISHENFDGLGNDWYGHVLAGELSEAFPYFGPENLRGTASTILHVFESRFYGPAHEREIIQDRALKVGDRDGWLLEVEFDFTDESEKNGWKWKKERAAIVLVDRPDAPRPAMLFISVPDNLDTSNVERVLNSLKLG